MRRAVLALVLGLAVWAFAAAEGPKDGPTTTSVSGQFRGSWMASRRGRRFQAYRGIWYAEPPIGELRFQPPKPILSYAQEVDASEEGPSCPLIAPPDYYVDEDCLRLNVYTPDNNRSASLPVVVYIHPGGFYSLTGRSDVAGPHYLLDRDLVLVTINYRLGSLGFLSTGDELAPGNNGFKDQVAALRWVQRNIAAFGGDPRLVTVAGCSAGAISAMLLMISPMSQGLFHRAISMSASPLGAEPLPRDLYQLAVRQAQILSCPIDNSSVIVNCLKKASWRDLGNSYNKFYEFGHDPVLIWRPVVERDFGQQRFLTEQPAPAARRSAHLVPHLITQTTDEFFWKAYTVLKNQTLLNVMNSNWEHVAPISFQLPRAHAAGPARRLRTEYLRDEPLNDDQVSADRLGRLYGDAIIGFNTHRMANFMCRHSDKKVFYGEFAYIGNHSYYEDPDTGKPTKAAHHDDTIYLLSQSYRFPAIPDDGSTDALMVDRMTGLWYNFAKYGDPNGPGSSPSLPLRWPAMTPAGRQYMVLAEPLAVRANLFEDRFNVWDELYPIDYEN